MVEAICAASERRLLRAEHRLHLRCEIMPDDAVEAVDRWIDLPLVGLLSINDHTPGQRQFLDPEKLRQLLHRQIRHDRGRSSRLFSARATRAASARTPSAHRREIVARAQARALPLASHDDATREHVQEAVENGMTIAEFPTTREAAQASREAGLAVLVGAPNLVMGGSHSGNIAAIDLLRDGQADILSSDYVPASLMESVFKLRGAEVGISLPEAVRAGLAQRRRAPWASATAARSRPAAAPTSCGCVNPRARPWCARCGAKVSASSDMAGALVYVMGPSGAGKDSVLERARAHAVGRPAGRLRPSLHHPPGRCRRREPRGAEPAPSSPCAAPTGCSPSIGTPMATTTASAARSMPGAPPASPSW